MSTAAARGRRGEDIARLYLEDCGYRCLAQRYRLPGGEIDLVMAGPEVLAFVEVKVAGPGALADPCARVDGRKLSLMRRMARHYVHRQGLPAGAWIRLDVVGIRMGGVGEGLELVHLVGVG